MAERMRMRELDDDEGRRLLRIIRLGTWSVVTWRRAQMILLSAQGSTAISPGEIVTPPTPVSRRVANRANVA